MNTEPTTSEFLLLARGTHWNKGLSPEELQKLISRSNAWFDRLIPDCLFGAIAKLLQIPLLDHVIIGQPGNARPGYFSFREAGMIA